MTNKPMLSVDLRAVLAMILDSLDRDALEGKFARGEMAQELRAILKRPACLKCNDTGAADSGGVHPWGECINIPCDCTQSEEPDNPYDGFTIKTNKTASRPVGLKKDQIVEVRGGGLTQIARADKTDWRNVEAWRVRP